MAVCRGPLESDWKQGQEPSSRREFKEESYTNSSWHISAANVTSDPCALRDSSMRASMNSPVEIKQASNEEVMPLRTRYRQQMNCQIVHDSIHRRPGWTTGYLLCVGGAPAGFGTQAMGGPWTDKPTLIEFFVLPEYSAHAFDLFEALLLTASSQFLEWQSNDSMFSVMCHTYGKEIASESILFRDARTTELGGMGAVLRQDTSEEELKKHIQARQGGGEWLLELDGEVVGKGGILFHYNLPFGDVYMEVSEPCRRRGLGSYLVQELKRQAYDRGAIPCARCNTTNTASRRTLQKAGFVPYAHILTACITDRSK